MPKSSVLTRGYIRARLAAGRTPRAQGDVATAARLVDAKDVLPLAPERYAAVGMNTTPLPPPTATRISAAVLILLVEHPQGFTVLFTQRTADLKAHAGQISFPGGRLEPGDADAVAAALRESREEIGLDSEGVEILGRLEPYVTVTGYEVTPVVGAVRPPLDVKPNPAEVAEIFEVPLSFLIEPANHQRHSRTAGDVVRAYYAMPYGERYIWGATAGMLLNLYDVLTAGP